MSECEEADCRAGKSVQDYVEAFESAQGEGGGPLRIVFAQLNTRIAFEER